MLWRGTSAREQSQLLADPAREVKPELYAMVCAACLGQLTWKRITGMPLGCICDKFNLRWPLRKAVLTLICKESQIVMN